MESSVEPSASDWLTVEEVVAALACDRTLVERLVTTRALRHERRTIAGEVTLVIPASELPRVGKLLQAHQSARRSRMVEEPTPVASTAEPTRDALMLRAQDFEDLKNTYEVLYSKLESRLLEARNELEQARSELREERERGSAEAEAERAGREELLAGVSEGLQSLRERAEEVGQTCVELDRLGARLQHAHDEAGQLRAARDALRQAEEQSRLRTAELQELRERERDGPQELRALREEAGGVQEELNAVREELRAEQEERTRLAREVEALENIERNNARYLARLESRLERFTTDC